MVRGQQPELTAQEQDPQQEALLRLPSRSGTCTEQKAPRLPAELSLHVPKRFLCSPTGTAACAPIPAAHTNIFSFCWARLVDELDSPLPAASHQRSAAEVNRVVLPYLYSAERKADLDVAVLFKN